jgi:alpha-D-xyloside xylohydrolase
VAEPCTLLGCGWRAPDGSWRPLGPDAARVERDGDHRYRIRFEHPGAEAVELVLAAPEAAQFLGGGERFERLDLRGSVVRHYLENAALGPGTYLPLPWIASTAGFALWLDGAEAVTFHLAAPWDPRVLRVQVEASQVLLHVDLGSLADQYRALIGRIGPPALPGPAFFGVWKAGDWRHEDATTVAADREGFRALGLPMAVKLIDAYWEDEVHSFEFDEAKYPDAWGMVRELQAEGTEVHLWLCPWVVVGTRSHAQAQAAGYCVVDARGEPIVRRPGSNPNVRAALIDFANPAARAWWTAALRRLLERGIAGFKADFGEQLPEHAVLYGGLTGPTAHNRYVRDYLEATMAAFDGRPAAVLSRSGQAQVRNQIWSGDQTSDFCPKSGLPAAIRAAQSASLSGFGFIGSDIGGYFGTPTPQVFARWVQFSCFQPLFMLHGLGCREPWAMDEASRRIFERYARLHLELRPTFLALAREAAAGGLPPVRMMPLVFPEVDWRGINDWDQQFMLGDSLLVAPAAFYVSTRAIHLPPGRWYDTLARQWVDGGRAVVHEVAIDAIPVFLRAGSAVRLHPQPQAAEVWVVHALDPEADPVHPTPDPGVRGAEAGMPGERQWRLADEGTAHHWLGPLAEIAPLPPSPPA